MALPLSADQLIFILRDTVVALVRQDQPDLSDRQFAIFLTCYLHDGLNTVRGLAADLNVNKPSVSRSLDRLGELDLIVRKVDPRDRRSVVVLPTTKGAAFLAELRDITAGAARSALTTTDNDARKTAG